MHRIATGSNPNLTAPTELNSVDESLDSIWSACENVVDDIARRAWGTGHAISFDDVTQEAALTVVQLIRSGRYSSEPTTESLGALKREVRWRVRDFLRAERRRQRRQATVDDNALERALARRATVSTSGTGGGLALARAVNSLSPRQRAVVAGIYYRESKVTELATELQVSPQAITALHRRALLAIRDEMLLRNTGPRNEPSDE